MEQPVPFLTHFCPLSIGVQSPEATSWAPSVAITFWRAKLALCLHGAPPFPDGPDDTKLAPMTGTSEASV